MRAGQSFESAGSVLSVSRAEDQIARPLNARSRVVAAIASI